MGGILISLTPEECWWPGTKPAVQSSAPATQHPMDDVEGIHKRRDLQQRQEKPVSAGWVGSFSEAGTHKATYAILLSKDLSPPSVESRCNESVPSRPILKRSSNNLSGKE
jgi:hypothetical protein